MTFIFRYMYYIMKHVPNLLGYFSFLCYIKLTYFYCVLFSSAGYIGEGRRGCTVIDHREVK